MNTFNERFAQLLEENPGSDFDVALQLGVSKQTVSAWKTGARSPKRPAIQTIANHFQVSVAWLMGQTDEREYSVRASIPHWLWASKEERYIVNAFRRLTPAGRKKVLEYMEDIEGNEKYRKEDADAIDEI